MPAKQAAAEGIYVSPKIIWGITQMSSVKLDWGGGDTDRIGSKTDNTFGGSIAIGYDFSRSMGVPVRAELEYAAFSRAKAKKSFAWADEGEIGGTDVGRGRGEQSFNIQTLFLNAYYDFKTGTIATPYIGAGLGLGFIRTKGGFSGSGVFQGYDDDWGMAPPADGAYSYSGRAGSKNVTNFAWNVGAGVGFELDKNWTVDVGYRFVGLGSVKTKSAIPSLTDAAGTVFTGGGIHTKTKNLYQHQIALGIRYTF